MKKTMSLLMAMALTMAAGLAWSQTAATKTCRKANCAMGEAKGACKAECPRAEGTCAMGEAKGACKAECPCKADGTCTMGEGKGACKGEGTCAMGQGQGQGKGGLGQGQGKGLGQGQGMKACDKTGCAAQKAACPKANATEKAE